MQVEVRKITEKELMDEFAAVTIFKDETTVSVDMYAMYMAEHSPARTQLFVLKLTSIPQCVHVMLVRHAIGTLHCVKTNREDRAGYTGDLGRWQPTNQAILLNAQSLMNIAKMRFCHHAHIEIRHVMHLIHDQLRVLDPDLARAMRPMCLYRGGICHEHRCCGKVPGVIHYKSAKAPNLEFTWDDTETACAKAAADREVNPSMLDLLVRMATGKKTTTERNDTAEFLWVNVYEGYSARAYTSRDAAELNSDGRVALAFGVMPDNPISK